MKNRVKKILICILICIAVGISASIATQSSISTWYPHLEKPFFNPPNWIFAPVWTLLYILMGIAAGIIWNKKTLYPSAVSNGLWIFTIQLFLNALWSFLFFGMKNPLFAFIDILLLIAAILWAIRSFKTISKFASYLLIPYLLWVSFAAILNISIWWLNK